MLLTHLQQFIQQENLFNVATDRIVLAVSGGVDSVVLVALFHQLGYHFAIAHCNFQLRGEESERDFKFVEALAKQYNVPFYSTIFNTLEYAETHKISIQIAARELRYTWLEQLRTTENYTYIATAHHQNDSIETFLINVTKGCGIRGLHGILPKQNVLIRPLLCTTKQAILDYAQTHKIKYVEDSSNLTDKYTRNFIRHQIIPKLQSLNPSLEQTFAQNFKHIIAAETLYDWAIEHWKTQIWKPISDTTVHILLKPIVNVNLAEIIVYELLKSYNFNATQVKEMLLSTKKGAFWRAGDFVIYNQLDYLVVSYFPITNTISTEYTIYSISNFPLTLDSNYTILASVEDYKTTTIFEKEPTIAYFDTALLNFPFILRKWREGDDFQPLGMQGKHKKVSDFLKDKAHLSYEQKQQVWILESQQTIAWVIGWRSSEAFKVQPKTSQVLKLEVKKI